MTTNGTIPAPEPTLDDELSLEERVVVLRAERKIILAQRTRMEIRYRIQTRLNGKEALLEIEAGLIHCEEALEETKQIAKEWGVPEGALTE